VFTGVLISLYAVWRMMHFDLSMTATQIVVAGLVQGLGSGLLFAPMSVLAYVTLAPRHRPEGTTVSTMLRTLGSSVGISLMEASLTRAGSAAHATLAGDIDLSHARWGKASLNFALITMSTVLVAIITEEGFFRGWLWASLERAGLGTAAVLAWSSLAFAAWHWSSVFLATDFAPPRAEAPILMLNAAVLGAAFGLLRSASRSVVVSSVSHGIWNGLAYVLFGFGTHVGVLGVKHAGVFGPELGVLGLVLNIASVVTLWIRTRSQPERTIE